MAMLHPFDPRINKPRPNADGSVSTELTRTVQFPDGSWGNVPSLWWGDGESYRDFGNLEDDQIAGLASNYEAQSGKAFPRFGSLAEAEAAAKTRSAAGGGETGTITTGAKPITLERLAEGIKRANAAGDTAAVQKLGTAYRQMQAGGGADMPPAGAVPGSKAYADWAVAQARAGKELPQVSAHTKFEAPKPNGLMDKAHVAAGSFLEGMPLIGSTLIDWAKKGRSAVQGMTPDEVNAEYEAEKAANPITSGVSSLAGGIAALAPLGATQVGGRLLGMTGGFGSRLLMGGLSGGAISGADTITRGGSLEDAGKSAVLGTLFGSAIPLAGAGARVVGNVARPYVGALTKPVAEAYRRAGSAFGRDATANPGGMMNAADEAVAAANGVPLINADRGGETVRALARSVANQSPEARAVIEKTASDRFAGQAGRAVEFIRRIAGGNVDDLGYQKGLKDAARLANEPRYRAAMDSPKAAFVWSEPLAELMQSPTFRQAVKAAESRGADKAAIAGVKAVKSPFAFDANDVMTIKTNPDGSRVLPSLAFWNQVKINLDRAIGVGQRAGDDISDLVGMKQKLVAALDAQVPAYAKARATAASYFGAEDALDAGKLFANKTRELPEARSAFNAMTPSERKAFRVGFASEIIDKIKDARFRANVIDQAFGSPAKREMMEIVFGKAKAHELEAYVKVEDLADKLRGALGNSTTARQLMELGIGAGSGALLTGGDWKGALGGAALVRGGRWITQRADAKVMQEVAKLLTSDDPALVQKAIANASMSPKWMEALERLEKLIAPAVPSVEASKRMPVEITVTGGNPALAGP